MVSVNRIERNEIKGILKYWKQLSGKNMSSQKLTGAMITHILDK